MQGKKRYLVLAAIQFVKLVGEMLVFLVALENFAKAWHIKLNSKDNNVQSEDINNSPYYAWLMTETAIFSLNLLCIALFLLASRFIELSSTKEKLVGKAWRVVHTYTHTDFLSYYRNEAEVIAAICSIVFYDFIQVIVRDFPFNMMRSEGRIIAGLSWINLLFLFYLVVKRVDLTYNEPYRNRYRLETQLVLGSYLAIFLLQLIVYFYLISNGNYDGFHNSPFCHVNLGINVGCILYGVRCGIRKEQLVAIWKNEMFTIAQKSIVHLTKRQEQLELMQKMRAGSEGSKKRQGLEVKISQCQLMVMHLQIIVELGIEPKPLDPSQKTIRLDSDSNTQNLRITSEAQSQFSTLYQALNQSVIIEER